jgi:hypothetical protein
MAALGERQGDLMVARLDPSGVVGIERLVEQQQAKWPSVAQRRETGVG